MPKTVTLQDVAAAAGVSIGTASRAMTGTGRVSPSTVERIRALAHTMGYHPNLIGQALRRGTSASVGMVLPGVHNPFYASLVHAVEAALHDNGYQLLISDSHADIDTERSRLQLLLARRVDGLLLVPSLAEGSVAALRETASAVPTVQLDRRVTEPLTDFVGVDNAAGIDLVIDHLVSVGVRTIAYIGSDDCTLTGRERFAALWAGVRRHGIECVSVYRRSFEPETGAEGVAAMLPTRPDAIVCGDDLIALGTLQALRRAGIRVPEDVLVTGFDDTQFAELSRPTLTTVCQPTSRLAHRAVGALIDRIAGSAHLAETTHLAPTLRIRESTTTSADLTEHS